MISQAVGFLNGKPLIYFQCETNEEAKSNQLQEGLYFFWKNGDDKITSPGEILNRLHTDIKNGEYTPSNFITMHDMSVMYAKLMENKYEFLIETLNKLRKQYIKNKMPQDVINQIDAQIKFYQGNPIPGNDGAFRPDEIQDKLMQKIYKTGHLQ